jgi:hypothetical protein
MGKGLTKAQAKILADLERGADLVNGDECAPQWWIERGARCHPKAAEALSRTPLVAYYRHEGGQPGVLFFRITEAGRAALQEQDK